MCVPFTHQVNGWYSSYEGAELDNPFAFYEVTQEERTIKVWVPVKK